ncbi:uncharacterized protein LOC127855074 isoform X1 [Dreissena polymorpha]|nr:uncharacterized protein LOC127855074 isoform X1 [Dreissena polymorpha]
MEQRGVFLTELAYALSLPQCNSSRAKFRLLMTVRVKRRFVVGGCLAVALLLVGVKLFLGVGDEIIIPGYDQLDLNEFPDPGIYEAEDFPSDGPSKVEKIIHQTWKTTEIPARYVDWMKSWSRNHPDWTYMFWTDESARALIADKYPQVLPAYDGYLENIRRADAMRYAILHEYGGVYADLDMESLQPLDPIIRKYSCVLPQEPYEHPIIDSNFEHLVINALMICSKGHPLMKKFLDNIPKFAHMWHVLDSTGPHYITLLYRQYLIDNNIEAGKTNGVYLAPAEYFFPTIDPVKFPYMRDRCYKQFAEMSHLQKTACVSLKRRGLERKPYPFSFTVHHWIHTYFVTRYSVSQPTDIHSFIPSVVIYKSKTEDVQSRITH